MGFEVSALGQGSPIFLTAGTGFVEDNFSTDWARGWGWFQDDSSALLYLSSV